MIEASFLYHLFILEWRKENLLIKEIRSTTEKYNSLSSQWETNLNFTVKRNISNKKSDLYYQSLNDTVKNYNK